MRGRGAKKEREFLGMREAGCKFHIVTKLLSVENSLLDHLDHYVLVRSNTPDMKLLVKQNASLAKAVIEHINRSPFNCFAAIICIFAKFS